jgi:hypothetical protein
MLAFMVRYANRIHFAKYRLLFTLTATRISNLERSVRLVLDYRAVYLGETARGAQGENVVTVRKTVSF